MLSLPPPPPPPPPPPWTPPRKQTMNTTPLNQIVITKPAMNKQTVASDEQNGSAKKLREQPILRQPRRANPMVWCAAILCLIFSLLLVFFGIGTLIIFLDVKPRNPVIDTPAASLNVIYFDSPQYFNGDFTFRANFSNPNRKLDVRFENLDIELYFSDSLIARQALQTFSQRQGETRLIAVHLISSLVYLPPNLSLELQKQVQSNRVSYNIRGTFRVRATLGLIHYSYWLHGRCQLEMTGPPTGVLITHSCKTKR